MKQIRVFTNQTEAHLCKTLLESHGIKTVILGAQEYVSHVMGGGHGKFKLLVDENKWDKAQELMKEVDSQMMSVDLRPNYFRRAVLMAIAAAIILPVVFNIASLSAGWKYWKNSRQDFGAIVRVLIILVLQLPTIWVLMFAMHMLSDLGGILGGGGTDIDF